MRAVLDMTIQNTTGSETVTRAQLRSLTTLRESRALTTSAILSFGVCCAVVVVAPAAAAAAAGTL